MFKEHGSSRQFDMFFRSFLEGIFGPSTETWPPMRQYDLGEFSDELERSMHADTTQFTQLDASVISPAQRANFVEHLQEREALFDSISYSDFSDRHFDVTELPSDAWVSDKDLFYFKVNHGYWEQLHVMFQIGADPESFRITNPDRYRKMYVASKFTDGLEYLFQRAIKKRGTAVSFDPLYFGFNLFSGVYSHQRLLAMSDGFDDTMRKMTRGAAIGGAAYIRSFWHAERFIAYDGAFPKLSLESGELDKVIERRLELADDVVFVTPPHLRGIHLMDVSTPQIQLYISRKVVHESWVTTLYSVGSRIASLMAEGRNPLIIIQCGAFSAMLALFLAEMKATLATPDQRITLLDLGQVLDVANPDDTGVWFRRQNPRRALFRCPD